MGDGTPMVLEPYEIRPDVFVVPSFTKAPGAVLGLHCNTLVVRGAEPVLVDTGDATLRTDWLEATFALVDPGDVRWVVVTHDDPDHAGNLAALVDACPGATVVGAAGCLPDALDVGDRVLRLVVPPLHDDPATRAVLDPASGVLWGSDLFATPVIEPTERATDLDPGFLFESFVRFHRWNSPWVASVDPDAFAASVAALAALRFEAIASAHGPVFDDDPSVARALALLRAVR